MMLYAMVCIGLFLHALSRGDIGFTQAALRGGGLALVVCAAMAAFSESAASVATAISEWGP